MFYKKWIINVCLSILMFIDLNGQISFSDTKFSPPNPEVHNFTKYGSLPIGSFTGTFQYDIPVYQISEGSLNHDISISYSTNGIKVDEMSSREGLGWNLNFGGTITRVIMDKPDEFSDKHYWPYNVSTPCDTCIGFWNHLKTYEQANGFDTQPDEYFYKVNNLSGKFLIDQNGQIRQFNKTGTRIEKLENGFVITNTEGEKYFFNLPETSRSTTLNNVEFVPTYTNTWYLTKIESAKNETIYFNYSLVQENVGNHSIQYLTSIAQNYETVLADGGGFSYTYYYGGSYMKGVGCNQTFPMHTSVSLDFRDAYMITSIVFTAGRIEFAYDDRIDIIGEKRLKSIKLINLNNEILKDFLLYQSYSNSPAGIYDSHVQGINLQNQFPELRKRLILDSVSITKAGISQKQTHSFKYDSLNFLPPRLSFSQDRFGYFNGASNPNYFFPRNTWIDILIGGFQFGANRDYSFTHSKKGVMEQVIYPTGGKTKIEYEPNKISNAGIMKLKLDTLSTNFISLYNSQVDISDTFRVSADNVVSRLSISCNWDIEPQVFFLDAYFISYSIVDINDQCVAFCSNHVLHVDNSISQVMNLGLLSTGLYKIKIVSNMPGLQTQVSVISSKWIFDSSDINGNGSGGVRVKFLHDSTFNKLVNSRKFLYNKWDQPNGSSGLAEFNDFSSVSVSRKFEALSGGEGLVSYCGSNIIHSNSALNVYYGQYNTVVYPTVIELFEGLDNSKGGIEYNYEISNENKNQPARPISYGNPTHVWNFSPMYIVGAPFSNNDFLTGKLKNQIIFTYELLGGLRSVKSVKKYFYSKLVDMTDSFYAVKSVIPLNAGPVNIYWKYFAYFDINKYYRNYGYSRLDSTLSIEYSYNQTGFDSLRNKEEYFYSAGNFQPTRLKTLDSKGSIIENLNYTVLEKAQIEGKINLATNHANALLDLQEKNQISGIVFSEVIKNSNLITRNVVNFEDFHHGLTLPGSIQMQNTNGPLETKVLFKKYDNFGNLLEKEGVDGIKECLIWGYNNQLPVASIVGSSYENVLLSSGVSLSILNNPLTSDISMREELNKIRIGLPNALVTTFTYLPLIGATSQTDPKGNISFFEYDPFGRLLHVRDQHNNIVKKFCYNYAGQPIQCYDQVYSNTAQSGSFTRNNCPSGQTGSTVTYTVPQGTITSYSQADANQQALLMVQQQGQAYANANGTCTPVSTCQWSNCNNNGPMFTCIGGICEQGFQIYTGEVFMDGQYYCRYHYEWSDLSRSIDYYILSGGFGCLQTDF